MKTILVTAFEPFNGESLNPSLEAARAVLSPGIGGVSIDLLELPVRRFAATDLVLARL